MRSHGLQEQQSRNSPLSLPCTVQPMNTKACMCRLLIQMLYVEEVGGSGVGSKGLGLEVDGQGFRDQEYGKLSCTKPTVGVTGGHMRMPSLMTAAAYGALSRSSYVIDSAPLFLRVTDRRRRLHERELTICSWIAARCRLL